MYDPIAKLSYRSTSTTTLENQVCLGNDIRVGIGDNHSTSDQGETGQIIDIVPQIDDMLRVKLSLVEYGRQDSFLVPHSLDGGQPELLAAGSYNGVGLGGENQHGNTCLAKHGDPKPIPPVGCHRFPPLLVHPDTVIGHDAIKVKP